MYQQFAEHLKGFNFDPTPLGLDRAVSEGEKNLQVLRVAVVKPLEKQRFEGFYSPKPSFWIANCLGFWSGLGGNDPTVTF